MLRASVAALAVFATALWLAPIGSRTAPGEARQVGAQSMVQSALPGYQVVFQFSQDSKVAARASRDQITVIFSNRSVEGPRPPRPFFGEDILQEFSFSGYDVENNQVRFTRRVRDKSFLDARYIRVVNHGANGWEGDKIWLTVDGEEIFRGLPMFPRVGPQATKGIQNFNPRTWPARSYWETALPPYRKTSRSQ